MSPASNNKVFGFSFLTLLIKLNLLEIPPLFGYFLSFTGKGSILLC